MIQKNRYYKTITISLNEGDVKLIESAVAYISFERKRNLPLSHFLRFLIQTYSDEAKEKFIDDITSDE